MNESSSHVYIVEDDDFGRDALVAVLEQVGLRTHAFSNAQQFLHSTPFSRPGCVILDLRIGQADGLDVQSHLLKNPNPLPVIVVTGRATVRDSVRVMQQGAVTLLEKPIEPSVLQRYVAETIAFDRLQTESHHHHMQLELIWASMTERQHSVLVLLVDGMPNKTIARQLGVSQRTVEIERSRLLEIFQVDSSAELVAKATEYRLMVREKNRPIRLIPMLRSTSGCGGTKPLTGRPVA